MSKKKKTCDVCNGIGMVHVSDRTTRIEAADKIYEMTEDGGIIMCPACRPQAYKKVKVLKGK